eukprot:NODE_3042_length_1289_cov_91.206690_g2887_i0.p1 GENE.NODE_3042_length_1289_cov_91.206690_g2887_i0~~NODE_3042_length_1289_cov_91.206690_g2887_i0.p1  ORF type:complete len:412 (-),score=115.62 NODE_3042_length_1289_cov_91.206690_g2887_i0:52-1233(-)
MAYDTPSRGDSMDYDSQDAGTGTYQTPGGSLSNVDFKKLMMTPRAVAETPVPDYLTRKKRKKDGQRIDTNDVFAKPKKQKSEDEQQYKRRKRAWEEKYRDRAAERNQGVNPDYQDDSKMLHEVGLADPNDKTASDTPTYTPAGTPGIGGITRVSAGLPATAMGLAASDEGQMLRNKEIRESIDKSKYLGGDVKHTHLVKGLDFALLQKVRQEIGHTTKEKEKEKEKEQAETVQATKKAGPTFQHAVAKNVFDIIKELSRKPKSVETFIPGRTCYMIDFDESAPEVPVCFSRPKFSLDSKIEDIHSAGCSADIIQNIAVICADRRKGLYGNIKDRKKREQMREKEKEKEKEREKQRDRLKEKDTDSKSSSKSSSKSKRSADDDIFPDAGEYRPP